MKIPATSLVTLFVPMFGPRGIDLSVYPVELALIPVSAGTEPAEADYHAATWLAPETGAVKEAALLIGPGGGTVYAAGEYRAFGRLTVGGEKPVLPGGRVIIGDPS